MSKSALTSRAETEEINAKIANILEYGKHGQPPRPFLKPAKNASRAQAMETMKRKLEEEVELLTSPLELATYKNAITEAMFKGIAWNVVSEEEGSKNTTAG